MQKHHPFADFPKRSIRQILLHSPRHCLGMGLIFSQPSLRHHELQSGWRRPHEILHCIPIFLLRAVLIAGDYREFLQIDLAAVETTAAVPPHQRWPIFPLLFSLSISNQADSHHTVNICQRVQAFLGRLFQ